MGYMGVELDRGQLFDLRGAINDEKLERLGYCALLPDDLDEVYECGECGSRFVDQRMRTGHGDKRHKVRHWDTPLLEDQRADQEERVIIQEAPPYFEKTTASQRGA